MNNRYPIIAAVAGLLCGCAGSPIANEVQARQNYEHSTADYRACLAANTASPQACDGKRLIMETDERHWQNLSTDLKGRLNPNNTSNQNITVQSR
jgi:hypothetical protein